jgi:uncharacterized membrane protein YfcA
MDIALSAGALGLLAAGLLAAGMVTGFLSGLLGIGGGGILVPVLYETFGALGVDPAIRMHVALGTSLAVVAPTTLRSFLAHRAKGTPDVGLIRQLGPWLVVGVVLGVLTAERSSSAALMAIWAVFGSLMALKMVLGRDDWRLGKAVPTGWGGAAFMVAVGFVSVLMSIAGAVFTVTFMTLYGRPLLRAVGTSAGFGPMIAVPGLVGLAWAGWGVSGLPPMSVGYVNVLGALVVMAASIATVPLGARMAHGISKRRLELAFALFLAVVSGRYIYLLLTGPA